MTAYESGFSLGWEEWLALPKLGLPAIRAKVDTGAKTSALHAMAVEPFGPAEKPQVRFTIQPVPEDASLEIICSAPVVDRRNIMSSNGETELRYIIKTPVTIGEKTWDIEVSLTNRENMNFRMLLGRSSIQDDIFVLPASRFQQSNLSYDLYKHIPRRKPVRRPLRIALLTREPDNYSSQKLMEAAVEREHIIEAIDTKRCYMSINAVKPEVHYDGDILPFYDAVIPRIGASMTFYGMAVLRQFEMMGSYILNSAHAIGVSRDKLYAHQLLASHRIAMPPTAFANSPKDTKDLVAIAGQAPVVVKLLESTQGKGVVLAETGKAAESLIDAFRNLEAHFLVQDFIEESAGTDIRCFVVGSKVVGAIKRSAQPGEFRSNLHRGGIAETVVLTKEERSMAVKAAKVMGLAVAGVDLLQTEAGPLILEVNSSPGLEGIENATEKDIAKMIIEFLEGNVSSVRRNNVEMH